MSETKAEQWPEETSSERRLFVTAHRMRRLGVEDRDAAAVDHGRDALRLWREYLEAEEAKTVGRQSGMARAARDARALLTRAQE